MDKKMEKYYQNTKDKKPNDILVKYISKYHQKKNNNGNIAIDLGCGAGRDSVYLLKHGFSVIGVDKENVAEIVTDKLNCREKKNFKFVNENFEKLEELRRFNKYNCNLLVANYSLSFCDKYEFNKMWKVIKNCIIIDGYFVGNLFGINDEWNNNQNNMSFFAKEDILKLFSDFNILELNEINKKSKTGLGEFKNWHFFEIIAKHNSREGI